MNSEFEKFLTEEGYTNVRVIDGVICATLRFIYTVGVCYGLDSTGYMDPTSVGTKRAVNVIHANED